MIDATALAAVLDSDQVRERLASAEEGFYASLMPRADD